MSDVSVFHWLSFRKDLSGLLPFEYRGRRRRASRFLSTRKMQFSVIEIIHVYAAKTSNYCSHTDHRDCDHLIQKGISKGSNVKGA